VFNNALGEAGGDWIEMVLRAAWRGSLKFQTSAPCCKRLGAKSFR